MAQRGLLVAEDPLVVEHLVKLCRLKDVTGVLNCLQLGVLHLLTPDRVSDIGVLLATGTAVG